MASTKISIMAARIRLKAYQDPHYPPGTTGRDIGDGEPQRAGSGTIEFWEDADQEALDAAMREAISENTYSGMVIGNSEELVTGDYYRPVFHDLDHDYVAFTVAFNEKKRQEAETRGVNPDAVADRFTVMVRNPYGE